MPTGGIRTLNRSKRVDVDPRLRQRGHTDRCTISYCTKNSDDQTKKSWSYI